MSIRTTFPVLVLVNLVASSIHGGTVPGRWEKLDALEPGSTIVLTFKAGDRMRCTFKGSDAISMRVKEQKGRELIIPKTHVARVEKQNSRDSKPAWIGTAIGAGTGAALGAFGGNKDAEGPFAKPEVAAITLGATGALVGFAIGYFTAENPPDELIYAGVVEPATTR